MPIPISKIIRGVTLKSNKFKYQVVVHEAYIAGLSLIRIRYLSKPISRDLGNYKNNSMICLHSVLLRLFDLWAVVFTTSNVQLYISINYSHKAQKQFIWRMP